MVPLLAEVMGRGDMDARGGHWWAWLIGVAVLAAVLGVIVWAVARATTHAPSARLGPRPGGSTAEEVLADRLARGEIDPEEYRQRLDALRRG